TLHLLQRMNEVDLDPADTELAARIATYELAFRMQQHAPEAVDLSKETTATRSAYGLDDAQTADFGTRCLLARRLWRGASALCSFIREAGRSSLSGTPTTI